MDGIILAGGLGMRMRPLTLTTPKPLLTLQDRPILAWSLLSLQGIVERVLVVAHYRREQIAQFMAEQRLFQDYAIVEQPIPRGTGHALRCCQDALHSDDFLVINGDDLFAKDALRRLSRQPCAILSMPRQDYHRYGVIVRSESGSLQAIDEKPPPGSYASPAPCSVGAYKLGRQVFAYALQESQRGELELTDYVTALAAERELAVVETPFWLPIGDARDLAAAQGVDIKRWIS